MSDPGFGGAAPPNESAAEHARASIEREQACDFSGAAREALLAGDPRRAAHMAALGGDRALVAQAIDAVATQLPADDGLRAARALAARGFGRDAGALFARLDAHGEAGEAFAAAGEAVDAARELSLAGRPADAARALEAALRVRPGDAAARIALGVLLARHGRTEAAVKTLQALDPAAPERAAALPVLRRCLTDLGLEEAARTLADEMKRLGVADAPPPSSGGPPRAAGRGERSIDGGAGPLVLGRYEVAREIAVTPHARVLEAKDRVTGEQVAVKLLAAVAGDEGRDALFRFEREARALAELRHPNVVPLRAYHPEGPAIVLAWMPGGTLAERLRAGAVAPARAVEIASAVLSALGEAHRLGILHRDVKPSNVLFDDSGAARLSDFGAAHLGDLSSTATAGAIGTFAYMSPEQRRGHPAGIASDVYGAGVLLAELLTGVAPGPVSPGGGQGAGHGLDPLPSACHPDLGEVHDSRRRPPAPGGSEEATDRRVRGAPPPARPRLARAHLGAPAGGAANAHVSPPAVFVGRAPHGVGRGGARRPRRGHPAPRRLARPRRPRARGRRGHARPRPRLRPRRPPRAAHRAPRRPRDGRRLGRRAARSRPRRRRARPLPRRPLPAARGDRSAPRGRRRPRAHRPGAPRTGTTAR